MPPKRCHGQLKILRGDHDMSIAFSAKCSSFSSSSIASEQLVCVWIPDHLRAIQVVLDYRPPITVGIALA
jgi:hypothetical protein